MKTVFFIAIKAMFLSGCTTSLYDKPVEQATFPIPTTACSYSDVERLSKYTADPIGPTHGLGQPLSEEQAISTCAPGPCKYQPPFTLPEFKNYAANEARAYQAEEIRFETVGDIYYTATTAILVRAKLGLADTQRPPTIKDMYYTHLSFRDIPCGTWTTYLK